MAQNLNQIDIGQGGAILIKTDAYTPPTGKVICAIQLLTDIKFASLTPSNSTGLRYLSTSGTGANANANAAGDGVGAKSFEVNDTVDTDEDTILVANNEFIYGRYSAVQLSAGSAICYLIDE